MGNTEKHSRMTANEIFEDMISGKMYKDIFLNSNLYQVVRQKDDRVTIQVVVKRTDVSPTKRGDVTTVKFTKWQEIESCERIMNGIRNEEFILCEQNDLNEYFTI
jgi:hypothetical protein